MLEEAVDRRRARLNAVDRGLRRYVRQLPSFVYLLFRRSHLKMILLHDRLPGRYYGVVGLPP